MKSKANRRYLLLIFFLLTLPVSLQSGIFHFGIPSAVKDKVEEIKEEKERAALPSIDIPALVNGSKISGTVNLVIEATNTVKVEIYMDGILEAIDTIEPYSYPLDTTHYGNGFHTLEIKAYNADGQTSNKQYSIIVANDNMPTITLTNSEEGATVSGTVILTVALTDDKEISKVEFDVDGVLKSVATSSPYNYSWDTTQYSDDTHTIKVVLYDMANRTANDQHSVIVKNGPTVVITAPAEGAVVSGPVWVAANVAGGTNKGIAKVEFYIDGQLKSTETFYYGYLWQTSKYGNGTHTVKVIVYNTANQTDSDQHSVTVNNTLQIDKNWKIETVDSDCSRTDISLVLERSNNPQIVYSTSTFDGSNSTIKYARWTGTAWSMETVDTGKDVVGYSLALDGSNKPHIAYSFIEFPSKGGMQSTLSYASWAGTVWNIETVSFFADGGVSLALDNSNRPHIVYTYEGSLKYAVWDGSKWNTEVVDSAIDCGYISLVLDSSNNAHISYTDMTNYDLKYAHWTGITWSKETVDSTGIVGGYTSLVLDTSANPHISYLDATNHNLKYAHWSGSAWIREIVDSTGKAVGEKTSLYLDSASNPRIAYFVNISGDNYLRYAYRTGSTWNKETVDSIGGLFAGGSSFVGGNASLVLDNTNNPSIAYFDGTDYSLKYAVRK